MSVFKQVILPYTWVFILIALTLTQDIVDQAPPRRGDDPDIPEGVSDILQKLSDKNASEWCLNWYKEEIENPIDMTGVLPCPPYSNLAKRDRRYERVTSDITRFHPGAYVCYVTKDTTEAGVQQECCYDFQCELIVGPGGGSVNRVTGSQEFPRSEHYRLDIYPYIKCCEETSNDPNLCGKYYDRRPNDNGTDYTPPPKHNITIEITCKDIISAPGPE